jgi:hypothetical protein
MLRLRLWGKNHGEQESRALGDHQHAEQKDDQLRGDRQT